MVLLQFPQFPHQLVDIRQFADPVHASEGDLPARIDNEGRALADAGHGRQFPQNAEPFCHRGVGIEVGAQRDADQADVILAPRNVAGDRIYADVQNLGIQGCELFAAGIEFGYLDGSGGSPVQGMKRDQQVLLAEIVARAERDSLLPRDGGEFEVGSGITDLQRHGCDSRRWRSRLRATSREPAGLPEAGSSKLTAPKKKGGLCGRPSSNFE